MSETTYSAPPDLAELEQRVQRLEVALVQETRALEDRIVDKVCLKMQGAIEKAIPAAPPPPVAPPRGSVPWLLFDIFRESKTMIAMLFDMRFHLAWSTRVVTLVLVPFILLANWVVPFASLPILGSILVNAINLVLSFVLFKCLSRDLRRYQEWKSW